jgi:4-carboxymuconolactone decarboxylase
MDDQYKKGLATREKVLGDAYVAGCCAGVDEFTQVLQDFVTRNAWGTVWEREGLEIKTRSFVMVAMQTAARPWQGR